MTTNAPPITALIYADSALADQALGTVERVQHGPAIDRGVPVLIAVPYRNIDPWRAFAGDLAREIHLTGTDDDLAFDHLCPAGAALAPTQPGPHSA